MRTINYDGIPEHCRDGLKRYIEEGVPPGGLLYAVLTNDLVGFFAHADDINIHHAFDYANWLYNECPTSAWKTPDKVKVWIEHNGLRGYAEYLAKKKGDGA